MNKKKLKQFNHKLDNLYTIPTISYTITRLQELLQNPKNGFVWTQCLEEKDVMFIYSLIAQSTDSKDFIPTQLQSKRAIAILRKLDLAKESSSKKKP